jgi:hypothetical protein
MKRVVTFFVVVLLIASLGVYTGNTRAEDKLNNERNATYIAVRWAPVGYNWAAERLYADQQRNFEIGGTYTGFGRDGYLMPRCTENPATGALVVPAPGAPLHNIPATEATSVQPRFWTEFYLTVDPQGGASTESDRWFAVVDSGGNIWFDPDGYFHDCRYYAFADPYPRSINFYAQDATSLFDNCQRNPKALVDPTTANNTQGPYPLLPTDENGNSNFGYIEAFRTRPIDTSTPAGMWANFPLEMPSGLGSTPMYFMEPTSKRVFRIGWVDRVDFPLRIGGPDVDNGANRQLGLTRALLPTVVGNTHDAEILAVRSSYWNIDRNYWNYSYDDWDIGTNLVKFRDGLHAAGVASPTHGTDGAFWRTPPVLPIPPGGELWDANTGGWINAANNINTTDNPIWDWGEEWHTDNISFRAIPVADLNQTNPSRYQTYEPGEWIYRAGFNQSRIYVRDFNRNFLIGYDPLENVIPFPAALADPHRADMGYGATRLTPVSVNVNGITYNYAPGTSPIDKGQLSGIGAFQFGIWDAGDDYDIAMMDALDPNGTGDNIPEPLTPRRLSPFVMNVNNFAPGGTLAVIPTEYDELHSENISNEVVGLQRAPLFHPYEHIYAKGYQDTDTGRVQNTNLRVQGGDERLSNVNSNRRPWAVWQPANTGNDTVRLGGLWVGDVLIMAEVLCAVSNDKDEYNLSVQTDLWEGMVPSQCTAVLRSQAGEVQERAQTVNKSTVVGPLPTSFAVPATSFMQCKPESRQYLGVQIYVDNGVDNNLGAQTYNNIMGTGLPEDRLYFNNLSDDYRPGRTGEMFLGAMDPNPNQTFFGWQSVPPAGAEQYYYQQGMVVKDIGRTLTRLDNLVPPVRFCDTRIQNIPGNVPEIAIYGCGEAIYRDINNNNEIDGSDERLTDRTITRSGVTVTYKAGSFVNPGDADVNSWPGAGDLHDFGPKDSLSLASWNNVFGSDRYSFPMFYDEYRVDPDNPERILPPNGTFDIGEIIYNTNYFYNGNIADAHVQPGFQRLTDGMIGNVYYGCGSIVPAYDFWLYPSICYGVTAGLNNDHRFMDWEVIPGDIKLKVQVDKALMVEQTSDIVVTVDPPPKPGFWRDMGDHRLWIPDEEVYILVRDPGGPSAPGGATNNIQAQYKVLTPATPKAIFTMTPYRGTCHPRNFMYSQTQIDQMKVRVQAFKLNKKVNIFPNRTHMTDIMVVPPDQQNGFVDQLYDPMGKGLIGPAGHPGGTNILTLAWSNGQFAVDNQIRIKGYIWAGQPDQIRTITAIAGNVLTLSAPLTFALQRYTVVIQEAGTGTTLGYNFRQETRHLYRDMFWSSDWVRLMNQKGNPATTGENWGKRFAMSGKKSPGFFTTDALNVGAGIDLVPAPPLPQTLAHQYDAYGEKHLDVLPEQLRVESNMACITTLDQRFPNMMLTLYDGDNPNDVNDPYGVPFSIPKISTTGQLQTFTAGVHDVLIATYNANGGGVAWLGVAELTTPLVPNEKIIFQANIDGTYEYWFWYEPNPTDPMLGPQIIGALDANDWVIGQQWGTFPITDCDNVKRTGIYVDSRVSWEDIDCSASANRPCNVWMPDGMKPIGEVTGMTGRALSSDHYGAFDGAFGYITSYGVPTYVTPFGEMIPSDPGGQCLVVVHPKDGATHMNIHVYLNNAIFDYNSTIAHPITGSPYFRWDNRIGINGPANATMFSMGETVNGIDYAGFLDMKVYPPDPYVNFAEWLVVDKPLQYSQVNYTVNSSLNPPTSLLPPPAPQIQPPYWPVLRTSHGGFRCYPGGQTHTGRITGQQFNQKGGAFGWNAYPAIWSEDTKRNPKAEKFFKLGTEFFPLSDYALYFILKDGEGKHLSFNSPVIDRQIKRIEIVGPYARPKVTNVAKNSVISGYDYFGMKNLPISYDYSGKIVIDETNYSYFERRGKNFTNWSALGDVNYGTNVNQLLARTKKLNYFSLDNVFVIDELIPWNYGKIYIYVTLADGTFKMYQDCCTAPPVDGIDVRALELKQTEGDENYPVMSHLALNLDQKLSFTLKEYEPIQTETYCNDAFMYVWQDRGVRDPADYTNKKLVGAGNGWPTMAPTSSRAENYHTQFLTDNDLNSDGKIKFNDWETEICGTYDMPSNTWRSGIIDARTFQRNSGRYDFELTKEAGARIDTVGWDFGGEENAGDPPDHIISDNELYSVYVTAYKYGDDNNDRSFGPWWDMDPTYAQFNSVSAKYDRTRYSHEVYIAAQVALPIEPLDDLIVTYTPNPLTSGITPELVDVNSPLSFIVKKATGEPVNLLAGIEDAWGKSEIKPEDAWKALFKDPHPDNWYYYGRTSTLPQYYFLRTDLHNQDGTDINNRELYSSRSRTMTSVTNTGDCGSETTQQCVERISEVFEPIAIDFSGAKSGSYIFRGFCANDNNTWLKDEDHPDREKWEREHLFRVYVYTPDRTSRGYVDIKVVNPQAEYSVVNTEDPQLRAFTVPGEPDFIMTAADNRIYKVTVTISNAQGQLVKGVTKGVSVCGGGVKNTARFTPFTTRPQSFDFKNQSCDFVPCSTVTYPHFGFDFNGDGNITWQDQELFQAGSFNLRPMNHRCWDRQGVGEVFYNTTNEYFRDNNSWNIINEGTAGQRVEVINLLLPPPAFGWGLGAIYSWPYWGGFLFNDMDRNGKLDYHDSLGLDVNAQTSFYLWAEDLFYVGGLVGDNVYCNTPVKADLVGYPPYSDKTNPRYTNKRFRHGVTNDTVFFLDWEGIPNRVAQVSYPRIDLYYAQTATEVSKELLNVDNYDMVYNLDNHFLARIYPAFKEDLPLKENSRLYVSGNQAQQSIYGHTKKSLEDDLATETVFHYTPTGDGQSTVYLSYMAKNAWYHKDPYKFESPEWYSLKKIYHIDVGMGLEVIISSDNLAPNTPAEITVFIQELGTGAPVADATVYVEGPGIQQTSVTTNAKGEAKIKVTPKSQGKIYVSAEREGYIPGSASVMIGRDNDPPMLDVDPLPSIIKTTTYDVTGKTEAGAKVTVNGTAARVDDSGKFTAKVTFKEGTNPVYVEALDASGNRTARTLYISVDTVPPMFVINDLNENEQLVIAKEETKLMVSGRVDPGSKVTINGQPAKVIYDLWELEVTVDANLPELQITLQFVDVAGNMTEKSIKIVRAQ